MDIRKFFSPTNGSKTEPTKHTKITSKDAVKGQEKTRKRRLVIDSDSDEEPIPVKKSVLPKANGLVQSPNKNKKLLTSPQRTKPNLQALKKFKREDKPLKPVSSNDFFKSPSNESTKKGQPEDYEEIEIEDYDFDKTLKELDEQQNISKNKLNVGKHIGKNNDSSKSTTKSSENKSPHRANEKLKQFQYNCFEEKNLHNENKKTKKQCAPEIKVEKEASKLEINGNINERESLRKEKTKVDLSRVHKETRENDSENSAKAKETSAVSKKVTPKKVTIKTEPSEDQEEKRKNDREKSVKTKETSTASKKVTPSKITIKTEPSDNDCENSTSAANKKSTPKKMAIKTEPTEKTPQNKRNSANYFSFMNREGPQSLGSKEVPEGEENCLEDLTFLVTGVLESFERDEIKDIVTKYGGKVMVTLSKNTKYMIVGRDAGPAKLDKAEKLGTKLINEDEFLDLIKTRPGKRPSSKTKKPKESPKQKESTKPDVKPILADVAVKIESPEVASSEIASSRTISEGTGLMWVDKYKPTSMKQVIGQQGDRSCANKLLHWLRNWWKNNSKDKKASQKKWGGKEDGSVFKAALLSGPPGIGKTTTAQLSCKEVGYQFIELNASDTRSKKNLQTEISELLQNQKITSSFAGSQLAQRHAVIFDEVDGMSGNEDRGGTQELIALIKNSKIPIICICNDRQHPKIRSLANYCFDLRFMKPRVEQIKGAMLTLLHKEKIKVPPETLHDIIVSTNQDMRQVLHHLSFLSSNSMADAKNPKTSVKDVKLSPFEVLRKVFSVDDAKMSFNEKSSLFFHDYSLSPLFVQENYPMVKPASAKADIHKHLNLLSEAADSISYADTIDRTIRSQNNWSLLPTEAIFASVVPGECMRGYMSQMISFPCWLGKNSARNHMDRVLQQVHMHTRLHVSANKTELGLDYLTQMKDRLTQPLIKEGNEGVPSVMETMQNYYLLREDLDSIVELSVWPNQKDPMTLIEPKTKAALTRSLNKESQKNPYSVVSVKKKGKKRSADSSFDGALDEDGAEEHKSGDESDDDDDINLDAMVKQVKQTKKDDVSTSKGKGRGKKTSTSTRGRK